VKYYVYTNTNALNKVSLRVERRFLALLGTGCGIGQSHCEARSGEAIRRSRCEERSNAAISSNNEIATLPSVAHNDKVIATLTLATRNNILFNAFILVREEGSEKKY
jgi:hypothetical protein